MSTAGIGTAFGLGFIYFIAAIPAGVAAGVPAWLAGLAAWMGYVAGGGVALMAGAPLRLWLVRTLHIPTARDPTKLIWRVWDRWGLVGLALLAPVTIGPQATAVIALTLGEKWPRILMAISLGVLPWCAAFAVLTTLGFSLAKS